MDAAAYRAGVDRATADRVALPAIADPDAVPPTPWDPALQHEVRNVGLALEQERVMGEVLTEQGAC
jgi:hypothetical protein